MRQARADARKDLLSKAAVRYAAEQAAGLSPRPQGQAPLARAHSSAQRELRFTLYDGEAVIAFGHRLNLNDLATWNNALWRCSNAKTVDLDFTSIGSLSTLAMLFITHQIRSFYEAHPDIRLHATGYQHLTYAAHVGFFDRLGAPFGKKVGEALGGPNYLPITSIDTRRFSVESGLHYVREAVEAESKKLSRMLVRTDQGPAYDTVQYSLREIIRNVFEHAGSRSVTYCAGYSPGNHRVEISIADEGQGIHQALTFNPKYQKLTERQALHHALMPGVSGNFRDLQASHSDST